MNVSNKDWIHANRFIQSASPKGSSQDRISEGVTIAGLEPVIVVYLPACVLHRIVLPGVCVLRMLENSGRGFHPEVEGDDVINSSVVAGKVKRYHGLDEINNALLDGQETQETAHFLFYHCSKKLPFVPSYASVYSENVHDCCLVKLLIRHRCLYSTR